jgi:XTP/dITP diphosphohydrolase
MQTIVFATNNNHKVIEMSRFFEEHFPGEFEIKTLKQAGFTDAIIEDADTFEGNAFIKASTVCKATGLIAIADDSGLEVDSLGGRPGVYSARYAGEGCSDNDNINKLLGELAGVPEEKRTARFVSVICACYPDGRTVQARGTCEGIILTEKRGSGDFGYDPVFYFPPLGKTFAELTTDIKNTVSHRGNALQQFALIFR